MLASLGFLVGEQVEGSSFLFDSNVTGPAINHFQQVPGLFWGLLGAAIFTVEASRVQYAWQNPFDAEKLFLLKDDYTPGDYNFDPLKLSKGKDEAWLNDMKLKEINNGRVAMVAISGMVAQELVNGLNLIPADEVLEMGKEGALKAMEAQCTGAPDEAACAKAFEAAERAATTRARFIGVGPLALRGADRLHTPRQKHGDGLASRRRLFLHLSYLIEEVLDVELRVQQRRPPSAQIYAVQDEVLERLLQTAGVPDQHRAHHPPPEQQHPNETRRGVVRLPDVHHDVFFRFALQRLRVVGSEQDRLESDSFGRSRADKCQSFVRVIDLAFSYGNRSRLETEKRRDVREELVVEPERVLVRVVGRYSRRERPRVPRLRPQTRLVPARGGVGGAVGRARGVAGDEDARVDAAARRRRALRAEARVDWWGGVHRRWRGGIHRRQLELKGIEDGD
eukprot:31215-Pelagococcus_subviridis.AAC.7